MGRIIAQVVLPGPSGQPTDVFVNTWQFLAATPGLDFAKGDRIAGTLDTFYGGIQNYYRDGMGTPFYKFYDADEAQPRTPLEFTATWQPTSSGSALPREVAVTMSFYGEKNTPSQRGRLYLGPLTLTSVSGGVRPSVAPAFQQDIVDAAEAAVLVLRAAGPPDIKWVVYSPTNQVTKEITDVWVDNAHDTIRSRGIEPDSRVTGVIDQS